MRLLKLNIELKKSSSYIIIMCRTVWIQIRPDKLSPGCLQRSLEKDTLIQTVLASFQ